MKRTAAFALVLALAAPVARGAQRKRLVDRARYHAGIAARAFRREIKSWFTAMRRHVGSVRRGVDNSATSVRRAGRRTVSQLQNLARSFSRQATSNVHRGLTLVAREFVPVGERALAPEVTAPAAITSPVTEPIFLRRKDIVLAWRISAGGKPMRRSYLLEENLLLENAANDVYALNPLNGITNWVFPIPGPSMYGYCFDKEFIGIIADDVLYEVDRELGLPRRRFVLPFPTASRPIFHGKNVILSSATDRIYALNRADRGHRWTYLATDRVLAGVAAGPEVAYVAQTDGKVFAYSPGGRRESWKYTVHDAVTVPLLVDGDNLYIVGHDLFVHALNRLGGFRVWKYPTRKLVTQQPWVTRETVYFAAEGDGLYAVSRAKGELLWKVPGARWPAAVGKKNLYVEGADQELWAVDRATGKKVWSVSAKPFTHFVRNTETDHFYLVTDRGQVYAFYVRGDHLEKKKVPTKPLRPPVEGPEAPGAPAAPAKPAEKKDEGDEF